MAGGGGFLKISGLSKRFEGVNAIDGLSINFKKGGIISIIGPNGSGKTTLTNVLTGILSPDDGLIVINDREVKGIKPFQIPSYGITRTFQEVRLFEQMTVLDNVLVVLTERGIFASIFEKHQKEHLQEAEEVLGRVGLWSKKDVLAVNLSYGQRKLLEIARVLAMDSAIIFFDEPFAGLFPEMIKVVFSIIQELKTGGKTIILIEHNMDLIRQLSDRVFVMDSGRLLAEGQAEEVLAKPEVIEAYLGE